MLKSGGFSCEKKIKQHREWLWRVTANFDGIVKEVWFDLRPK